MKKTIIDIDESFITDPRMDELVGMVGNKMSCYGAVLNLWLVGFTYWKQDQGLIPLNIGKKLPHMDQMVAAEFVDAQATGYYVRGSRDRWSWYSSWQKKSSDGGSKSTKAKSVAALRREAKKRELRKNNNVGTTNTTKPPTNHNHHKPSSSSSSSSSSVTATSTSSSTDEIQNTNTFPNANSKNGTSPSADASAGVRAKVWLAYSDAYQRRYGESPVRNAKVNSLIKQLVTRLGEEAEGVVEFYVHHNDSYYCKCAHSLEPCVKNAEGLRTQWKTGRKITSGEIKNLERNDNLASQLQRMKGVL